MMQPVRQDNKLMQDIQSLALYSSVVVEESDCMIIHLEKNVMDENETDLEDEAHRKELRPLVNETMNYIKINRNLMQLLLSEISIAQAQAKTAGTMFTTRFATRYNKVNDEIELTTKQVKEALHNLSQKCPNIFDTLMLKFSPEKQQVLAMLGKY